MILNKKQYDHILMLKSLITLGITNKQASKILKGKKKCHSMMK